MRPEVEFHRPLELPTLMPYFVSVCLSHSEYFFPSENSPQLLRYGYTMFNLPFWPESCMPYITGGYAFPQGWRLAQLGGGEGELGTGLLLLSPTPSGMSLGIPLMFCCSLLTEEILGTNQMAQ